MASVATVGTGVAGLGAALALHDAGLEVHLLEAAPRLGGRASTVHRGTIQFDDGAQFLRTDTPFAEEMITRRLPTTDLIDVRADVLPFTADGAIGTGDPAQNSAPKWVYRQGLAHLSTLLCEAALPASVRLGCTVLRVEDDGGSWTVVTERGSVSGFNAVVLTPPPAALARLLTASRLTAPSALGGASHRPIISVTFGLAAPLPSPGGCYALVNTDRGHAISWLAFEDRKPGYVPSGGVITAQMAAAWSAPRMAAADRSIGCDAARVIEQVLGTPLSHRWYHVTCWAEALPDTIVSAAEVESQLPPGVFVAGDVYAGGRLHLGLESGYRAGERAASWLGHRRR
jgi:hypothetical protein